ncbi:LysR family transcriptional regulator [Budviciaceae bacterium CWB-B4]|uniref:LysR family transcriptional regulator n=1 Tax=Limnobaculum xujianqingii TaxID=2738837 RepID=A0A9D7AKB0_9GAMM|nr:LysR family transcriptional regulator [Limnobaculum xujianqingii]MBK5074244.1 LysR family transcriptional regulator [Limnobaculum xujianqingii]MBK5177553.1 LysR family transcriptional regulator [Limnobaculum xujianqingii]
MDRFTSMSVFVAVVEKGSFVAAAEAMKISPTMVGKHISALEHALKTKLLVRTTRRQGLTEAGQLYYQHSRRIVDDMTKVETLVHSLKTTPTGRLKITAPYAFGNHILIPLISQFLELYPEINIEIELADRKVNLIEEGFDFAFRIGEIVDERLVAKALPDYEMVLAATPDYLEKHGTPDTPQALRHHNCLGYNQHQSEKLWQSIGITPNEGESLPSRLVINSGEGARQAALMNFTIVLQSKVILEQDLLNGRLVRVLPEFSLPSYPMHLVYLPQKEMPLKTEAFISFMMEKLWQRMMTLSHL